jgi:catechol 2,3-dioxygenase-like lactoylglutathione lyase family enzyme
MSAKIKHVAFASNNAPRLARFYESLFGMKRSKAAPPPSPDPEPQDATVGISDGNIGMVVIRRAPGFIAALDHFGIEVEDIEGVSARLRRYPHVSAAKRPSYRSFAAYSGHDPAGNVFDLTEPDSKNRRGIFAEPPRRHARFISHITIRTLDPASLASFYTDVFGFKEETKALEDPNFYLTDGEVTLVVSPWKIADYLGASVARPGLEHLGFKVESVEAVKRDLEMMIQSNPDLAPRTVTKTSEGEVIRNLASTWRYSRHLFSDPDGTYVDISEV